jgi:predicted Fe-Mo cluster-binding NifX family protein
MKTAFAAWKGRIAPVFDVCGRIHIVEAEAGRIVGERSEDLNDEVQVRKALQLAELGVRTLVCGGISRPLQLLIEAQGIAVVSFVRGDLREVIDAWAKGRLTKTVFMMPGRRGPFRRRQGRGGKAHRA